MPTIELTDAELATLRLALNAAEALGIASRIMHQIHPEELQEIAARRFSHEPSAAQEEIRKRARLLVFPGGRQRRKAVSE